MEKQDYLKLVKRQIELDKLLHSVNPENHQLLRELFDKN